jgi:hypothetical protein
MKTASLVFAGTLLAIAIYVFLLFFTLPFARVTVKVLDEAGNPVPNATVSFSFVDKLHSTWGSPAEYSIKTKTNAAGIASEWGPSEGTMPCDIQKDGYYYGGPWIPPFNDISFFLHLWLPWNPKCVVVLKKILNPVPMYARPVRLVMPAQDQPVGFDLAAGDWVEPFGKGMTSDFIFTISNAFKDRENFSLKVALSFTNKGDGLQLVKDNSWKQGVSVMNFPRNAPEDGYAANFSMVVSDDGTAYKDDHAYDFGYFFRVRTTESAQGKIEHTCYGKIKGPISTFGAATAHPGVEFTYYLNPDGTTNLEADPSKNLFKNLDEFEVIKVQYP